MNLMDLVNRTPDPAPWSEGDNIPWHDPDFSRRMLKEHLCQDHDAASRRFSKIKKHVNWIHHEVLSGRPTRILDLGCGPGLYSSRLARMGHECVGIDYSPASIAYARDYARKGNLRCEYIHEDIRTAEYGHGFGLVMLIFGEFNVFKPADAQVILEKAYRAIDGDGILLLEPHTFDAVREMGMSGSLWYSANSGVFSDQPYLCLEEHFWTYMDNTATTRFFVIDASTGSVSRYAQSFQAYTEDEYFSIINKSGFNYVEYLPSLIGVEDSSQKSLMAIVAESIAGT